MAKTITVRRQEPVLVIPSKPTKKESKELSDIDDQQTLRIQIPLILAYRGNDSFKEAAKVIKEALAEALVHYYPLAGRLREGDNRKLIVDCNGEGVLFIEADANVKLEEVENQIIPPCPLLGDLLYDVPGSSQILGTPLLLFQITSFLCGSFILGVRFNHTMCDGKGVMELLSAVSELSNAVQVPSTLPVWERELLRARSLPKETYTHHEYGKVYDYEKVNKDQGNTIIGSAFYFSREDIKVIRNHLPPHLRNSSSTYDILCACVWRCRTLALELDPEEILSLTYVANVRDIMSLPPGYYGNAVVFPSIATKAKHLLHDHDSLTYALSLIKKARGQVNKEYTQSVMDFLVINGRPLKKEHFTNLFVTNYMRLGSEIVQFGGCTPFYFGCPRGLYAMDIFTKYKNGKGEDFIVLSLGLPIQTIIRLQIELKKMVREPSKSLEIMQPVYINSML